MPGFFDQGGRWVPGPAVAPAPVELIHTVTATDGTRDQDAIVLHCTCGEVMGAEYEMAAQVAYMDHAREKHNGRTRLSDLRASRALSET